MELLGSGILLITLAVIIGVLLLIGLFKLMWRVARPNQALIISGRKRSTAPDEPDSMSFRIVTGGGTFVVPLKEQVDVLDLSSEQVMPTVNCPTTQGITVGVKGVVIFKIGDDEHSIANAARRFLGKQQFMAAQMEELFAGQLRSIVGGMTVEDMIQNRTALTQQTREACAREAQSLGLVIDSLQIQEIQDPSRYIENIAAPNLAEVKKTARIAQAQADQAATEVEEEAKIAMAEAKQATTMREAHIQSEVEARQAEAAEQGPLARTTAQQQVLEQEAILAERQAAVREQELRAEVRLTAEAEAHATRVRAQADRDAAVLQAEAQAETARVTGAARAEAYKAEGEAEADVARAKGEAEGAALEAKARGVAANQEAVLGQMLVEQMPEIVRAAASMFGNVGNLTVLDGAEGMQRSAMSLLTVGTQVFETLKGIIPTTTTHAPAGSEVQVSSGDSRVE